MQNTIKLTIKVQPNARKNEIAGLNNNVLRLKIAAPPDKGKANRELIEFLSGILGLKKDAISILSGLTSHNKLIAITGSTREEIMMRLSPKI